MRCRRDDKIQYQITNVYVFQKTFTDNKRENPLKNIKPT